MTARLTDEPRRREAPEVRRTQILDAAEALLVERGLHTSIADIADAAGVAKGTVYLYFSSRDELLAALRARYLERFCDTVRTPLAPGPRTDTKAAVIAFADALFAWGERHRRLHYVLFKEAGVCEDDALAYGRALLVELVTEGIAAGTVHVTDADLTARALLDAIHGIFVATIMPDRPERDRYERTVRELVPRVLGTSLS
jgi:AcrR family transcriptional regulator